MCWPSASGSVETVLISIRRSGRPFSVTDCGFTSIPSTLYGNGGRPEMLGVTNTTLLTGARSSSRWTFTLWRADPHALDLSAGRDRLPERAGRCLSRRCSTTSGRL